MSQIPFAFTPHRQTADEATTTIPPVEPRVITDLPNEILHKIFSYLSSGHKWRDINETMWDFSSTSKEDIKNVRLSCRRLSENASRHLIRNVTIDLSEASLANLERISTHPEIRYGVQTVEISLAQYDDGLAGNLALFATHHMSNLPRYGGNSLETKSKAASISNTWGKYLQARISRDDTFLDNFGREEIVYIRALVHGYYRYQDRLREQEHLLQASGFADFVVRVTALIATLPVAKHLEVTDWDTVRWGRQSLHSNRYLDISSEESLVHSLVQRRSTFGEVQGTNLLRLMPGLLSAGTDITSLNIQISPPVYSYRQLSLLSLPEHLMRSSLSNLRSLRFEHYKYLPTNPERDQQGFRSLSRFLDACLESEKLECLIIDPKITFSPEVSLISPRPWPKLKYAVLKRLSLTDSDLETLTASIACQQGGLLIMNYVRLCGGTWAGVLDMLRNRRIRVSLGYQAGAECDSMPRGWVIEIFGLKHGLGTFAEHYARGEDMPNPILSPPSEELGEMLASFPSNSQGGPVIENGETVEDEY